MSDGLQADADTFMVEAAHAHPDLLFFRTVRVRLSRQRLVPLPAAAAREVTGDELRITTHSSQVIDGVRIVSVEPQKPTAVSHTISVLSACRVGAVTLRGHSSRAISCFRVWIGM